MEPATQPQNSESEKKTKKSKKPLIITGAIALILGCIAGAYLYNKQVTDLKKQLESSNQKIEQLQKEVNSSSDQTSTDTPTDSTKYLVIKEWGVKIPVTGALTGASYVPKSGNEENSYILVTAQGLIDISPNCKLTASSTDSVVYIHRLSETKANEPGGYLGDSTLKEAFPNGVTVAGYYYYTSVGQAVSVCEEAVGSNNPEIKKVRDATNSALKLIKVSQ